MITFLVYLLLHILRSVATTDSEDILLSCGSNSNLKSSDGRSWDGDVGTELSPDINATDISFPATPVGQNASINITVPYLTARIITSKLSYIFPLSSGQKIIRLYFYPTTYSTIAQSFNKTQSRFNVTANQYTLLSNFNASLAVSSLKPIAAYSVKEFIVNVQKTQALNVTFLPMQNRYPFINGIEIVPIPGKVYTCTTPCVKGDDVARSHINQNKSSFEAVYRINVGGGTVVGKDDSSMFRQWLPDDSFLVGLTTGYTSSNGTIHVNYTLQTPNYSAPQTVYQTARVSAELQWKFQVETGFYYMLRLHFCEFTPHLVYSSGQRVFTVVINNKTAEMKADIMNWTGGIGIPVFKDYVHFVDSEHSKQELSLTLRPYNDHKAPVYGPILNGVEIFKVERTGIMARWTDHSKEQYGVDWRNDVGSYQSGGSSAEKLAKYFLWLVGFIFGSLFLLGLIQTCCKAGENGPNVKEQNSDKTPNQVRQANENSLVVGFGPIQSRWSTETSMSTLPLPVTSWPDLCRRFLLEEIKAATSDFDPALVIGTGGFGNVYRGSISHNLTVTAVAIKRSDPGSGQGLPEFRTEIEMLSRLRHLHLVSLIGYCDDESEMILVYDYMPNGTLRDHLYQTENPPLTWKQRLEICIGAARGLNYLHNEANPIIVHRDVKSNNILLDENWVAKISDFGLSKMGAPDESFVHFSTNVKGTFGYLDPEYFFTKKLTRKSDVYAFGVVLFEVLSGRPAVDMQLDEEQHSLASWARYCIRNGQVEKLIDSEMRGQISPACLKVFLEVAVRCLDKRPQERPAMGDLVVSLQFASALQQNPSLGQEVGMEIPTKPAKETLHLFHEIEEILD